MQAPIFIMLFLWVAILANVSRANTETCTKLNSVSKMTPEEVKAELTLYMRDFGFVRPLRSKIDPSLNWKNGPPNYDVADLLYFRGKSMNHTVGSLETVVENLVKKWEMEATHLNFTDWTVVAHDVYKISANGGRKFNVSENAEVGNYNTLMANVDKSLYDIDKETFESSHTLFGNSFLGGFPWEILEVFSGPPRTAWSWRHWARFEGEYKGRKGDGKVYEMYGIGFAELNDEGKVTELEIYYKPEEFLRALEGKVDVDVLKRGGSIVGSGCPFIKAQESDGIGGTCSV